MTFDQKTTNPVWVSQTANVISRVWFHQKLLRKKYLLIKALTFGLTFLQILFEATNASLWYQTLSFAQSLDISEPKCDFESHKLIIWFCKLEHTLAYSIFLSYFFIIKTSVALFKTHFGSTIRIGTYFHYSDAHQSFPPYWVNISWSD
jgi:hypothetical protein